LDLLARHYLPPAMNGKFLIWGTVLLSVTVLLQACSLQTAPTAGFEPTTTLDSTQLPSVPEATATAASFEDDAQKPTREPTPTVWPPVFDLWSLEDIRSLDSFVVTVNERNTVNGQLTMRTFTIGYIQEPYSAYHVNEYQGGVDRTYVVNDRTYELTGSGDWYISAGKQDGLFSEADPARNAGKLVEARFAGETEYEGIAAYHFVLDPASSTESTTDYQLEGELYRAREGNYILFSHWRETSKQGDFSQTYEVTSTLKSINQLPEISLPADMEEMVSTAELPFELGLPLPPDSTFRGMIRYKHGIGVDLYSFSTPKTTIEEFLGFYRDQPSVDGWSVSHVGHVSLHQDDCEFTRECVIINKGSTQVVLYYNGASIRAEFDWRHLYSPLN
jgi:hypothetical protein